MSTLLQWVMHIKIPIICTSLVFVLLIACNRQDDIEPTNAKEPPVTIERSGWLASQEILEASGMQASHSRRGDFFVHNDEGKPVIYAVDESGADLGSVLVVPAKNKDWEDMTSVVVEQGRWLVLGDIGDNQARRDSIKLYFVDEPQTGENNRYSGEQDLRHWLTLTYPDGARDCEAMAYDPVDKQILLLSKRDKPPRLYAVDIETALSKDAAVLKFLGTISPLRPPTIKDRAKWGGRVDFISQPTGLDISADGMEAVVISYRSLYRYKRHPDESWLSALNRRPEEVVGPPAVQNEAIAFAQDGNSIFVTTEKLPAPIYRIEFRE